MNVTVQVVCDNSLEESACGLIAISCEREVFQKSRNYFTIEAKDCRRAADLLHAIGSVLDTSRNYTNTVRP